MEAKELKHVVKRLGKAMSGFWLGDSDSFIKIGDFKCKQNLANLKMMAFDPTGAVIFQWTPKDRWRLCEWTLSVSKLNDLCGAIESTTKIKS